MTRGTSVSSDTSVNTMVSPGILSTTIVTGISESTSTMIVNSSPAHPIGVLARPTVTDGIKVTSILSRLGQNSFPETDTAYSPLSVTVIICVVSPVDQSNAAFVTLELRT